MIGFETVSEARKRYSAVWMVVREKLHTLQRVGREQICWQLMRQGDGSHGSPSLGGTMIWTCLERKRLEYSLFGGQTQQFHWALRNSRWELASVPRRVFKRRISYDDGQLSLGHAQDSGTTSVF